MRLILHPDEAAWRLHHTHSIVTSELYAVRKNSESDPSEAKRNDICGNITSRLV